MPEHDRHIRANISLLYVEDDDATREQVARALQTRGYKVICACNGEEGVALFRENAPDIVLTDIMMPRLNGLDMAQQIRALSPETMIVCMTAFSDTSYMVQAIEIGVNQFVLKPIEFVRLFSALERCQETVLLRRHQKLMEAEKQRADKMEAIAILAGGMAHDFNNLLQVILGYVSLAHMSAEPGSKTESMLAIVERSAESAKALSARLLTFAKGGDVFMKPLQFGALLQQQIATLLAAEPTITTTFDLPADLPVIKADATQLEQVITNLTNNAREAMPHGGIFSVQATTEEFAPHNDYSLPPGHYIHLQFSDNGVGITPENLPRIFDPYFSTKAIGSLKGTGLGLALCSSIIKHHGGHIHAESAPGEATCFHVYLPVYDPAGHLASQVLIHS